MRICALIKYPPIQGGVSAQCFWTARGLAEAGHQVDVVTNAGSVEEEYRLLLGEEDRAFLVGDFPSGGRLRLHDLEPFSPKLTHIPQSNPFVSRLAGLAAEVVRRENAEVIFSYYLEPYGVAAHLAAAWTGVPYVAHHAGSDIGRLMNQQGLGTTYREVLRRADGICVGSPYPFLGLGARREALYRDPPFSAPREHFRPDAQPLDLARHVAEVAALRPDLVRSPGALDPEAPVIGIYGKMGEVKGSYDLLGALGGLRRRGLRFNFVALTRGREMERYLAAVETNGLSEVTWVLPFLPHWRVPGFVRACDAVCFLERDFPIKFHTPSVAREVLSCGTCLVVSGEIAGKQLFREAMTSGENCLVVADPRDHDELAAALERVIRDPPAAAEIGRRGAELVPGTDAGASIDSYTAIFADVVARHRGEAAVLGAAERGLPASRRQLLADLVSPLLAALGEAAEAALDRHLAASPDEPEDPFVDAERLCDEVAADAERRGDRALADAARYARLLVWLGHLEPEDARHPPFPTNDAMAGVDRTAWRLARLADLAPLASHWLRVESFDVLPESGGGGEGGDGGGGRSGTVVFHKRPNANGHHFRVNAATAELLGRCDGRRTVRQLGEAYRRDAAAPPAGDGVERQLFAALRRFYVEGMIVFVEPAAR